VSPALPLRRTGCLLCGADIVYLHASERMICALCGDARESTTRCAAGHHACDACHSGSAKDVIERFCVRSTLTDPVEIALGLMRHPALKMHGAEHHFLVPAALLAAWYNARGEPKRKEERIAEARLRSEALAGGFCGIQGACGAGIGTGIFVALATEATPLKGTERGLANRMTAAALELISRTGGARCCKRDSLLALLEAARFTREHLGVELEAHGPRCEFTDLNAECIEGDCPFYPREAAATRP
jgi:hypothetical protein